MDFKDNDDYIEAQRKEHQAKKQKKLDKQARLLRKKELIEEMKVSFECSGNEIKIGGVEWAFRILKANHTFKYVEIKKNYLQLAQQFHPDKNHGEDIQQMKDLNEAWEVIKKIF